MRRNQPILAALTGGSAVVMAVHSPLVVAVIAALLLLVCVGVILPAVWSTKPTRRRAAVNVLQQLLRDPHALGDHDDGPPPRRTD